MAEKVTELLYNIVGQNNAYSPRSNKELENIDFSKLMKNPVKAKGEDKKEILRIKVRTVARMARMFKNLRYESLHCLICL